MALQISQRKEEEVPGTSGGGRNNDDLVSLKNEMSKLPAGMVLEIDTGSEKSVRGAKMMITRAARQLGTEWKHWSVDGKVFAKPEGATKRRGRPKKEA